MERLVPFVCYLFIEIGLLKALELYLCLSSLGYREDRPSRDAEKAVAKTICAFMNSKGGTLLIGVDDQRHALGLEKDFANLSRGDRDGFEQKLIGIINSFVGKEKGAHVHISWLREENKDISVVKVDRGQRETYLIANPPEFYIRTGNTSQPLNVQEATAYIRDHWS